jgi:hypothetical protein
MKVKIILFLALISLVTGCATQKRCNIKFPSVNDTIRIEHTRDSIVIRDTTIFISVPGERVVDSVPIPCPPPPPWYVPKKVHAETQYAYAEAWWSYPNIKLLLVQKDTTLQIQLRQAIKEKYYWKSLYEKVHITPSPVKYIPKIYKQAMSICILIFAAALILIGWKAYTFFKK